MATPRHGFASGDAEPDGVADGDGAPAGVSVLDPHPRKRSAARPKTARASMPRGYHRAMTLRVNRRIRRLVDSATGSEVDPKGFGRPIGLAPASGKPIVIEYDHDAVRAELGAGGFDPSGGAGLWR